MASPQVVAEYKARYTDSSSVIASRMRGEIVNRDANLVLLGTSSLYHVGSSQYNRIKFPTAKGEIEYKLIGKTEGFGSVHLSRLSYDAIQEVLKSEARQLRHDWQESETLRARKEKTRPDQSLASEHTAS